MIDKKAPVRALYMSAALFLTLPSAHTFAAAPAATAQPFVVADAQLREYDGCVQTRGCMCTCAA